MFTFLPGPFLVQFSGPFYLSTDKTAKMNNINPHLYLQKVLATIQDYNHKKIADLLPWVSVRQTRPCYLIYSNLISFGYIPRRLRRNMEE